jgi:hypothetical protein
VCDDGNRVYTVDITGAYLNANMGSVKVHMQLDKRITDMIMSLDQSYNRYVTLVVLLDKALYGCVEAALDYGMNAYWSVGAHWFRQKCVGSMRD